MQDGSDFSLPIVVVLPERRVVVSDEHASTTPFVRAPLPGVDARPAPLPAARHAWLPSKTVAARPRMRHLRSLPPPPTRATPLSDDDEKRMQRRVRAYRRQAWAQRLLERFQFEA
ncbi:MAG TPA: hypothetical protein VF334_20650 [Polyangia bacterium]